MNTLSRTAAFDAWLSRLRDNRGKALILARIRSAECGGFGDARPVGDGISEMRIHFGPGYRLYLTRKGDDHYVLLCGGTKDQQVRDIRKAQLMARQLKGI